MKNLHIALLIVAGGAIACSSQPGSPSEQADGELILRGISRSALSYHAATIESAVVAGPQCESVVAGATVATARLRMESACGIRDSDDVFPCTDAVVLALSPDRPLSTIGVGEEGVVFFQPFPFENDCGAGFTLIDVHTATPGASVDEITETIGVVESQVSPMTPQEVWSTDAVADAE